MGRIAGGNFDMGNSFSRPAGLPILLACLSWVTMTCAQTPEGSIRSAKTGATRALSLDQAKNVAFQNNWDLLAARSDVDQATAQKIIARQFPNPTLSLSTTKIGVDGHPSSTADGNSFWERSYDSIVAINQLFEIGGKRSNRQMSAQAGYKAAEARLEDARRLLDLAVTKAYISVLLAETNVHILRQSADSLRKEAAIADTRLQAGDISKAEKSQIEIAADRLDLGAKTAAAAAASARITVEVLLGLPNPDGTWAPGDSLETLASLPPMASDFSPGAFRPDLLAAEAALHKAEADVQFARAQRIPDPSLFAQYEHEPPDQPNTVGFGVSLPLPLWNRNKGNILAAQSAQQQAVYQVEKIKSQIAGEIAGAHLAYDDAAARLRQQREVIEPKSAEVRKTVSFAYEKGGASLLDLLSAERNDNEVRLATAQAAADAAAAAASLNAALHHRPESTKKGSP